jgi:NAD(P)-dependent dehydrogenase (short-subunit alcohol dehydrogenase family)
MKLGLQGKVATVTRASKGIGKAVAAELAAGGVHVALSALAVFLASARTSYITGALMQVDGGATRCM